MCSEVTKKLLYNTDYTFQQNHCLFEYFGIRSGLVTKDHLSVLRSGSKTGMSETPIPEMLILFQIILYFRNGLRCSAGCHLTEGF